MTVLTSRPRCPTLSSSESGLPVSVDDRDDRQRLLIYKEFNKRHKQTKGHETLPTKTVK